MKWEWREVSWYQRVGLSRYLTIFVDWHDVQYFNFDMINEYQKSLKWYFARTLSSISQWSLCVTITEFVYIGQVIASWLWFHSWQKHLSRMLSQLYANDVSILVPRSCVDQWSLPLYPGSLAKLFLITGLGALSKVNFRKLITFHCHELFFSFLSSVISQWCFCGGCCDLGTITLYTWKLIEVKVHANFSNGIQNLTPFHVFGIWLSNRIRCLNIIIWFLFLNPEYNKRIRIGLINLIINTYYFSSSSTASSFIPVFSLCRSVIRITNINVR